MPQSNKQPPASRPDVFRRVAGRGVALLSTLSLALRPLAEPKRIPRQLSAVLMVLIAALLEELGIGAGILSGTLFF